MQEGADCFKLTVGRGVMQGGVAVVVLGGDGGGVGEEDGDYFGGAVPGGGHHLLSSFGMSDEGFKKTELGVVGLTASAPCLLRQLTLPSNFSAKTRATSSWPFAASIRGVSQSAFLEMPSSSWPASMRCSYGPQPLSI